MTRIVLLGTSHVAALWQGWRRIEAQWPDVEVTAFAVPGTTGNAARLRGRRFGFFGPQAQKVNVFGYDKGAIPLTDFDHVIRVANSFHEASVVPLLQEFSIDGITPRGEARPNLMSNTSGTQIISALAETDIPTRNWHNWQTPKVTIMPAPYPDSRFVTARVPPLFQARQWLTRRPDEMLAVRAIYTPARRAALARIGLTLFSQPEETIGPDGLSLEGYSRGSLSMVRDATHGDTEFLHMNADYGELTMTRLLTQLTPKQHRLPAKAASA